MPKAKLTFAKADAKKLTVAAHYSNVTLGESVVIGNDLIIETSYRDAQSLIKMADLKNVVTGNELDGIAKAEKEKAAAKK